LPVIFNWPILLMPLHIVFFELIVDPASSVVFEAEPAEPGIMRRRPRPAQSRLFGRSTVWIGLLQGLGVFVTVFTAYAMAIHRGHPSNDARAIAFTALIAGNLALIWANRSLSRMVLQTGNWRNPALSIITVGSLATLLAILYIPQARAIFEFSLMHVRDLAAAFALGFLSIAWFELLKFVGRRREPR
jgi:P-type Ca2+ transporter type 2C